MGTAKWVGAGLLAIGALMLGWATPAAAEVTSERAASILMYPKILVDTELGVDTVVQLSNTSNQLVNLHCFYINANSHCSISGEVCHPQDDIPCPNPADVCLPGWTETDFRVYVTAEQPIGWVASWGFADAEIPLDGIFFTGPTGESNVGTRIPPVPEDPFIGELKCIVIDANGRAIARNVIKGEATIVNYHPVEEPPRPLTTGGGAGTNEIVPPIDVKKYNAIGVEGIDGDANGDGKLVLGGGANEYNGCPNVLIVDHFFDFASNPVSGDTITSNLTLVPCQQDLLNQVPGGSVVQYLVFNEFEQRFSTSTPIQCLFDSQLSKIDTRNPERSIFSTFVAGTLTGQTRVRGIGSGLVGILAEHREAAGLAYACGAAINLQMQGERPQADEIVLP